MSPDSIFTPNAIFTPFATPDDLGYNLGPTLYLFQSAPVNN
jgi:hypothetical protein